MRTLEHELINDTIHAHRPAHQLQTRVGRVAVDEVVAVEVGQALAADAAGDGGDVVDVGLLHHRAHCLRDGALAELVQAVLVPDGFEVEVRAVDQRFEEGQGAGVRDGGRGAAVVLVGGNHEVGGCFGVDVGGGDAWVCAGDIGAGGMPEDGFGGLCC